ncbi:hypothetical protein LUX33_25045 [Actinomadura madurae]|nr:diacylglycerol kinase family protein [Actinomadura madurae]MCP9951368.1 hypothetical protein [Actinomadura madurae]
MLLFTNANAGTHDAETVEKVAGLLRDAGRDVTVCPSASSGDLDQALDGDRDAVAVAAGGDGSINRLVGALYRRGELDRTVGLVPMGTGNDLARNLGVPLDPEDAARLLLDGGPARAGPDRGRGRPRDAQRGPRGHRGGRRSERHAVQVAHEGRRLPAGRDPGGHAALRMAAEGRGGRRARRRGQVPDGGAQQRVRHRRAVRPSSPRTATPGTASSNWSSRQPPDPSRGSPTPCTCGREPTGSGTTSCTARRAASPSAARTSGSTATARCPAPTRGARGPCTRRRGA